jgi:lipoate-protein ligase B
MSDLWTCHLGRVEYREAAALQERLRERVIAGELPDTVLLLEHPPVYTLGRRSEPGDLPLSEEFLRTRGIDVVKTPRGGKLTYHAPGQLVGYPVMHVANVVEFVHAMEGAIVAALGEAGIEATTRDGREYTGVWVGERKIASIGIHLSHGVSSHGFAVNVENDMAPFEWAVACGLPGVHMTSMRAEGSREGVACFRKRVGHAFARELGRRQRLVTPRRLDDREPAWTSA